MASNCVADVRRLCTAAAKRGHAQFGQIQTPAEWAKIAGYSGSAASPLRQHMARNSSNGCGRSGRYPAMSAGDLLELLDLADGYVKADTAKQQDVQRRRIRAQLYKDRAAARKGAARTKVAPKKRAAKKASPVPAAVDVPTPAPTEEGAAA